MTATTDLKEQLPCLYEVQIVDEEIRQLSDQRRSAVRRVRVLDAEREREQAKLEAQRQAFTTARVEHQRKNTELLASQEKLVGYIGKQMNARDANEYVALTKQIETTTHITNELEEETIALLIAVDDERDALAAEESSVGEMEETHREQRKILLRGARTVDEELGRRKEVRAGLAEHVEATILRDYDTWCERTDLTMVSKVITTETPERAGKSSPMIVTFSCGECHMLIPTHLMLQAKSYVKRQTCPSCHRVLFVPIEDPAESDDGVDR